MNDIQTKAIQPLAIIEATMGHRHPVLADGQKLATTILVRCATPDDRSTLAHLAELDSTAVPGGHTVMAEVGGHPVAALSLHEGKVVADPFVHTEDVVALLRLRAKQLRPPTRFRRHRRLRRL